MLVLVTIMIVFIAGGAGIGSAIATAADMSSTAFLVAAGAGGVVGLGVFLGLVWVGAHMIHVQ